MEASMTIRGWIILGMLNIPLYWFLGKVFFKDLDDFLESVRFWLTPNIFSAFRGEYWDDVFAEIKFMFWVGFSIAAVIGEAHWLMDNGYFTMLYKSIPVAEVLDGI